MKRIVEVNLILGLWLIVAPFVLAYSRGHAVVALNDIVFGLLIAADATVILAAVASHPGLTLFGGACGAWLMCAPLVLHSRAVPHVFINDLAIGAIVLVVSITHAWLLARSPRHAR